MTRSRKTRSTSKSTAKKAPARPTRRAAPGTGPLTLDQARKLAGVVDETAAPAPVRRGAQGSGGATRRRQLPAPGLATSPEVTPATVALERRKLELIERKLRLQRMRDYKATLLLLQKRGVKDLPQAVSQSPSGRRRAPGVAGPAAGGPLRIFAEGDSWFDYPVPLFGGGLVSRLEKRLGVPILNLAKAGDETRFMLGVDQRQVIARQFTQGSPDGAPWDLMLFSGGGNDVVAQPLALWLKDFQAGATARQSLNQPRFSNALALVKSAYEDLIELRDQLSPSTHLAFHAYDLAIPDGRGICHLGPWLKPAFDLRGFPADRVQSTAVVKEMLEQFAAMLQPFAAQPRVTFINVQKTLVPVPASWHNEMHPSKAGFNLIADKFHTVIKQLFPGRVLD